jgi:hypothetical protein
VTGLVGALGATIHGAHDVAVLANPVSSPSGLPSQLDPRGFLTFAVTGLGLGLFGWLARRTGRLPRPLGLAGVLAAVLLQLVYLGRLITLDPNANVIRLSAVAAGLVVVPAFYLLAARSLLGPSDT